MSDTPEGKILAALATYTQRSGAQLSAMTGLSVAELYPALYRLETEGRISSEWEDVPPPRQRRYKLAEGGTA